MAINRTSSVTAKASERFTKAGQAFTKALTENYQAAKRITKRQTGLVGFGAIAAESYKKDGSIRNAAKTATNALIDNTADNLKDIYGIFTNHAGLKAIQAFVQ